MAGAWPTTSAVTSTSWNAVPSQIKAGDVKTLQIEAKSYNNAKYTTANAMFNVSLLGKQARARASTEYY